MGLSDQERRALALQEVHRHRPSGLQAVLTISLSHPSMDEVAHVVADNEALEARLETGELVTFRPVAFRANGPAQSESRWPEIELSIDGVNSQIEPLLDQSLDSDEPIDVVFREFIRARALDGPGRVIGGLELDRTSADDLRITGTAGFYGLDRKFGRTYDPSIYPGIG